jgi:hypothetical protein
MVSETLANGWHILDYRNVELLKLFPRPDTGVHQDLGVVK